MIYHDLKVLHGMIVDYFIGHNIMPSMREVMDMSDLESTSTVLRYYERMVEAGLMTRVSRGSRCKYALKGVEIRRSE